MLAPGPALHSGDGDDDVRPWPVTQHPIVSAFLRPREARSKTGPLGYPLGWVWVLLLRERNRRNHFRKQVLSQCPLTSGSPREGN